MTILFEVNYLAVFIAAIVAMVVGALWFSPSLFGKKWAKALGKDARGMKGGKPEMQPLFLMFVGTLITAFVLGMLITYAGAWGVWGGLKIAGLVWLGFTATAMFSSTLFENRSLSWFWVSGGHMLVAYLVMGLIIGVMGPV